MAERLRQIARGVQHVGGDHHVEAVRRETLPAGIGFDVENAVVDERIRGEALPRGLAKKAAEKSV